MFGIPIELHLEATGRQVPLVVAKCAAYIDAVVRGLPVIVDLLGEKRIRGLTSGILTPLAVRTY